MGTLIEHESGLRAELAYPDRLRLVCGMCWHAGVFSPDVVGVSRTSRGTLLALCERHARGTDGSEPDPEILERELLSAYVVDQLPDDAVAPHGATRPGAPGARGGACLRRLPRWACCSSACSWR